MCLPLRAKQTSASLLILEFFSNHTKCLFGAPAHLLFQLITCTEIYDLNTNIPVSKIQ